MATQTGKRKSEPAVAETAREPIWGGRLLDGALTGAACLSFYVLCMLLPLVGKAGSKVDWAAKNRTTFLVALAITLLFSALAVVSRLERRRRCGGPFPLLQIGLLAAGGLLLLFGRWLSI